MHGVSTMREAQVLALVVDTPCAYVLQSGKAETNSYLAVLSMHFTSPFYAFLDDRTHTVGLLAFFSFAAYRNDTLQL